MKKQTSAATETVNKGKTTIDYAGKTVYTGIDTHKKDWQVASMHDGLVLGDNRIDANQDILVDFLKKRYPGAHLKCVYESGAWGFNLQRALTKAGIECIVVHAGDVPGSDKEKKNKTDRVDARRLARHHAAGLLTAIHVPEPQLQKERNLVRYRKSLVRDLTCSKNRLKSLLKFEGIDIPAKMDNRHWSANFIKWVDQQAVNDITMQLMIEQIKMLRQHLAKTEKELRALMKTECYDTRNKLLLSVPGVGEKLSALFLLEVGDIKRFRGFDPLNNLVGFYPGSNSSGEKEMNTGISKRRHNELRTMLVEAAWKAIKIDPALLDAYEQLKKRMKGQEAIIRIARKLLRRMRMVLMNQETYELGIVK